MFISGGKASTSALTTVFIFSFFETIFKGLKALSALKTRKKETYPCTTAFSTQVRIETTTIKKSKIFQESFK